MDSETRSRNCVPERFASRAMTIGKISVIAISPTCCSAETTKIAQGGFSSTA